MRLKKLTLQAFGPFKDRIEIDFEKNNINQGLLLITGDTGAGKTSIFDAICFALYGESSGDERKANSLRSDFASPDIETFVELEFYHNNKLYIVKRSPEYERSSKRGGGTTKQVSTAEFEINGRKETKVNAVTKEIENLLGLDYKQFCQVAMLSQGEFTKFLLAPSDEKTSIFRKIFNTENYNLIMSKLKSDASSKGKDCEIIKNYIEKEREKINKDEYKILSNDEFIEKISIEIEDENKKLVEIKEKREKINDERNKKQAIYDRLDELNKKIEKYIDFSNKLKELLIENKNIDNEKKLLQYNRNIVNEINNIIKEFDLNKNDLEENKENLNKANESKKIFEKEYKEKENDFKKIEVFDEISEKYSSELQKLNKYIENLNNYKKLNDKLVEEQKQYKILIDKLKIENENYLLMKENYYSNIAYSLASKLEENKPCPVCGSLYHPHLAEVKENSCTKENLDTEELLVNDLLKKVKSSETKIDDYKNSIKEFGFKENINFNYELSNANENLKKIEEEKKKIKIENERLIKEKEILNKSITSIKTKIETFEEANKKYNLRINELNEKLEKFLEKNETTLEEYYKNKLEKNNLQILEDKISKFDNEKTFYEATINTLEDETKGKKIQKINKKKEELDLLNLKYKEIDKNFISISNELIILNGIKENIEKYYKEFKRKVKEYELVKKLSDTANGVLVGKQRITFENYVQSYYLTNVLIEANKRLLKMTDGRYKLKRKTISKNLSEKLGLEFSIFDGYTGKERDVSSLSGGEKFKASLSLALGLSDVISMYVGGIKMDCLFVDEGFGSLDSESLNQAIDTLTNLVDNDKLIGIISHVSELESKIDKKIKVKKYNNGSKIEIEG